MLYQSGVTLPPGRFSVKAVVRENTTGLMGTFESAIIVPELKKEPMKVSSVVVSTQLEPAAKGKTDNPLVRDGVQLVPEPHPRRRRATRSCIFYYEVYDPAQADGRRRRSAPAWRSIAAR